MAAGLMCLLISLPMPVVLSAVWQLALLVAGGFFSVYLYNRRSGHALTIRGGARMGWITGLFCFVIVTVFFTIGILGVAANQGLAAFFQEMVSQRGTPEISEQFNQLLQTPGGLASLVGGILVMFFLMLTILPAVGGALGAKVLEKE